MNIRGIIAFVLFFVLIAMGIMLGGKFSSFIDLPSVLITVGGGLLLAFINIPVGGLFGAIGAGLGSRDLGAEEGKAAAGALETLGRSLIGAGIIGTIIGLVNMGHTGSLDDTQAWQGFATAILTTLYGLILNYAVTEPLRRSVVSRTQVS